MTLLSQTVIDFFKSKKIHIKNMSNKVNTIKKVRKILNNDKSNCAFIIRQSKKRRKEQRGYINYLKLNHIDPNRGTTLISYKGKYFRFKYDAPTQKRHTKEHFTRVFINPETKCCICYEDTLKNVQEYSPTICYDCQNPVCDVCYQKLQKKECPCCRKPYHDEEDTTSKESGGTTIRIDNPAVASVVFDLLSSNFPMFNISRN
jgi:hypothetical protein